MEEQPALLATNNDKKKSATSSSQQTPHKKQSTRRLPTPEELISHYESKGFDSKQASLRVIADLHNALSRVVTNKTPRYTNTNTMLRMLDMKIDSKPGFIQMFAIGLASSAVFRGLDTLLLPQVIASFGNIWNALRSATGSDPK